MTRSAKNSVRVLVETTEKNSLRYFTIYEVKGVKDDGEKVIIQRCLNKDVALNVQEAYYDIDTYKTVYIMEQTVWVD